MNNDWKKQPYSERSDIDKIRSNWRKAQGLLGRQEWSGAIVRAATAAEIAANLVVREEYQEKRGLAPELVDHFLKWANGLLGKFDRLILPAINGSPHAERIAGLKNDILRLNSTRNSIVHSGSFDNEVPSTELVTLAEKIIKALVEPYVNNLSLPESKESAEGK